MKVTEKKSLADQLYSQVSEMDPENRLSMLIGLLAWAVDKSGEKPQAVVERLL